MTAIDLSGGDVTPTPSPRAFYVGGAGDIVIIALDDTVAVTLTVPAGVIIPVEVKTFVDSGTDATNIVAIY